MTPREVATATAAVRESTPKARPARVAQRVAEGRLGDRGSAVLDLLVRLTRECATATVLVTHDRAHLGEADAVREVADGRLVTAVRR